MNDKIKQAINEYESLQSRKTNPSGAFDDAGRWYPNESEKCDCCDTIRSPSRKWPYSLMTHCRTLKHICSKHNVDFSEVKKAMRNHK